MAPSVDQPVQSHQPSTAPHEKRAQPWRKWLEEEMKVSGKPSEGDSDKRPWTSWKPNPQDPSEKPWLYWKSKKGPQEHDSKRSDDDDDDDDDSTEMVGTLSRFTSMGTKIGIHGKRQTPEQPFRLFQNALWLNMA